MIAAMVVGLHVAGLSLVLFQGCGKGAGPETAGAGTNDTSTAAMSYPSVDTNPPSAMFASATNAPTPGAMAMAPTNNTYIPPAPTTGFGAPTSATPSLPGITQDPSMATATPDQPVLTGLEKDYQVRKGDTLTSIALRNGVSLSGIARVNPNLDPKKLRVGQTIKLPAPAPTSVAAAGTGSTPPTGAAATAATGQKTYKVKSGDTLTKIARIHGITVNQLRAANNMKTMQVQAGKVLKIPAANQRTAAAPASTNLH
jgi:LysM repeat protein